MVSRFRVAIGVMILLSMGLVACTPSPRVPLVETVVVEKTVEVEKTIEIEVIVTATSAPEKPASPKTLVVCQSEEPDSLYPYGSTTLASIHVQQAIYDGPLDNRTYAYQPTILKKLPELGGDDALINAVTVQAGDIVIDSGGAPVELDSGVQVRPAGCRSSACAVEFTGEPMEMDQMVVRFELLEGLVWSNGDALTADDSVYSFELAADPDTPVARYAVERTASYEAVSGTVVIWAGLPGYTDDLYYTNFWHPFPRKLWQDELGYTSADLLDAPESSRMPMGWGPFVITEWVEGDHITVERNSNYFRAEEGLPYVDRIIFRFLNDPAEVLAQLISGECDIATHDTGLDDQAGLLVSLEHEGVLKPIFSTTAVWEHVDVGINPAPDYDRPDLFEDVRVRQAIAMCLDRQKVAGSVLSAPSSVIDSYVPPEHPLYADGLTTWSYDPDAAMILLDEAGWVDSDGDGIREANDIEGIRDGTPLEFNWQTTTASLRLRYGEIFQQNLADCGIRVNLIDMSADELFANGPDGPVFGRRFDLVSFPWLVDVLPSCDLYMAVNIPKEDNGWVGYNSAGFDDTAYDEQCARAMSALPGTTEYIAAHMEAQRIFSEQLPAIPLFLHPKIAAVRPEVLGFILDPTEQSEMWNIEAFDLNAE